MARRLWYSRVDVVEGGARIRELLTASLLLLAHGRAWAEPVSPAPPPERSHGGVQVESLALRQQANAAYLEGRYDEAILLLDRANALAPYALHSFNLGAVQHKLGRCELARDLFERYLSDDPDGPARADAELALEELYAQCGRRRSAETALGPAARAAPAELPAAASPLTSVVVVADPGGAGTSALETGSPSAAASVSAEPRPSAREIAAWSTLAAGGAAAIVAVASTILVRRAEADLEALSRGRGRVWNGEEARALEANGERYQALAFASGFGSALLLGTGIGLLLMDEPEQHVRVVASGDATLLYSRRF